jgi:hypothetical protein
MLAAGYFFLRRSEDQKKLVHEKLNLLESKVHLRTGHEDVERELRYRSILSLTSVLGRGSWSTPRPSLCTGG